MKNIFVSTYELFNRKKYLFATSLIAILLVLAYFLSSLSLEEDVRAIIPQDSKLKDINMVLDKSKLSDRLIVTLSNEKDATPDDLLSKAEEFVSQIEGDTLIKNINFKVDDSAFFQVYDFFYSYLPFYLTDADYAKLESQLADSTIRNTIEKDYRSLLSPAGMATKRYIFKDPLSITTLALEKLKYFKLDENFIINNGCVFTKDLNHLLIFIEPVYPGANTKKNALLIENLDKAIQKVNETESAVSIEYYGGTAVAVANAYRIKTDIMITVTAVIVIIFLLVFFYFKSLKLISFLFLPVVFGFGVAISFMSILTGSISAIALGIGSILVGLSVDYPLYFFTQFKNNKTVPEIIKDLSVPLLMCAATSAIAFFCLYIIPSPALNQIGLFGAFSVIFTALFVLIFIPFLLNKLNKNDKLARAQSDLRILDRIAEYPIEKKKYLLILILIFTLIFGFFSNRYSFNSDIASLNYLPPHLATAEENLNAISSESKSAVYFASVGNSMDEAIRKSERVNKKLAQPELKALYNSKSSGADLILSQQEQAKRIEKWNAFWDRMGRERVMASINAKATELRFKPGAFSAFENQLSTEFSPIPASEFQALQESFLSNYISSSDSTSMVITILKVDKQNKDKLFKAFDNDTNVIIFDKQHFSNSFFEVLKNNFDKLVWISMAFVFLILLISFGRIELAIITMAPIVLSWLWTLGLMGIFNLEFNIFNIIISTLIFGSGVDYCILIMKGLQNNFTYGNHSLKPYRVSILLSSITSIIGLSGLFFAQHTALKSIPLLSVFGIATVVFLGNTLMPQMYNWLTRHNGKRRIEPITMKDFLMSLFIAVQFITCMLTMALIIPVLYILPIPRKTVKYLYHVLICYSNKYILASGITSTIRYQNMHKLDFKKPSVIIANHQSYLDLALILKLHPKIIVLTNKKVWRNPYYGLMVRFADFYPVYKGIENGIDPIRKKVEQGYSVLIFPEGTRTRDGQIKRFHQGALMLADELGVDLQPILIHGAYECSNKNEFFLRSGVMTVKIMDRIKVRSLADIQEETYRLQTKEITRLFRAEFAQMVLDEKTPKYFRSHVINQYIYKGPVLEWYIRVKMMLENNYSFLNDILPRKAKIVDIGCGYGYIAYLLNCVSPEREICGIDYDEEKINIAKHVAKKRDGLKFKAMDVVEDAIPKADVYLLLDVLHYFPAEQQKAVLNKCISQLPEGGMIVLRDADADLIERTKVTKATEYQSTKVLKFNKLKYELCFVSGKMIADIAAANGMSCERYDQTKRTSNISYVLRK